MITAEIIKDSITGSIDNRNRITTWKLTYQRFIHAEFMTHRVFSRNAASSRAIPITKMIRSVIEDPAEPVWWGANQKGMQAATELVGIKKQIAKFVWRKGRYLAVCLAWLMNKLGLHKQIANRVLEPWMQMTIIATATDMGNFFKLRAHKDAQPEFQVLANKMLDVYNQSIPDELAEGEWHIPFSDRMPNDIDTDTKLKIATARCARVSYLTFDGEIDVTKDIELHDRLAKSGHWSPFEHCAFASTQFPNSIGGNFKGWSQYRKYMFSNVEDAKDSRIIKK